MSSFNLQNLISDRKHRFAVVEDSNGIQTYLLPNEIKSVSDYDYDTKSLQGLSESVKQRFDQVYNLIDIITESDSYNGDGSYSDNISLMPMYKAEEFQGVSYVNENFESDNPLESALQMGLNSDWIMLTQVGGMGYALVSKTGSVPLYENEQYRQYSTILTLYEYNNYDTDMDRKLQEDPKLLMDGVQFNYIAEIPLDFYYYDFDKAVSFYNLTKLKNMYNAEFHMDGSRADDWRSVKLDKVREYNNMGTVSEDGMWLSYKYSDYYGSSSTNNDLKDYYYDDNYFYGFIYKSDNKPTPQQQYNAYFEHISGLTDLTDDLYYFLPMKYDNFDMELRMKGYSSTNFLIPVNSQSSLEMDGENTEDMMGFVVAYNGTNALAVVRSNAGYFPNTDNNEVNWSLVYLSSGSNPVILQQSNVIDNFKGQATESRRWNESAVYNLYNMRKEYADDGDPVYIFGGDSDKINDFATDYEKSIRDTGMKMKIVREGDIVTCYATDRGVESHSTDHFNSPWKDQAVLQVNLNNTYNSVDLSEFTGEQRIGFCYWNGYCHFQVDSFKSPYGDWLPKWNEVIVKDEEIENDDGSISAGKIYTVGINDSGATAWTDTGYYLNDLVQTCKIKNPDTGDYFYVTEGISISNKNTMPSEFRTEGDYLRLTPVKHNYTGDLSEFEFLDKISYVHKLSPQKKHKSNLYSIELKDTGLNTGIEDDDTKEFVQNSVKNVIRNISERIQPANTKLFKIEFTGD